MICQVKFGGKAGRRAEVTAEAEVNELTKEKAQESRGGQGQASGVPLRDSRVVCLGQHCDVRLGNSKPGQYSLCVHQAYAAESKGL